ncbi:MAG: replication factor C large subunit [Candidatus Aenigmarchaeota archaeon]|nr:replication factor C large subunit [Candidatus Aenigmarchaeota archaeon]
MAWTKKYEPRSLRDFVNQKDAVEKFLVWVKSWKPGNKAMLFYGPPGVGKTALVRAYAYENKLDLIEMNASDFRTAKKINEIFGSAMRQRSLWHRGKIFLIDEVDGICKEDVGAINAILKIIQQSHYPVVLTANDIWNPKLSVIRNYSIPVQFKKLSVWDIVKRLEYICQKEGIKVEKSVLRELASRSQGDLRAAINDLEVVGRGKKEITQKDLQVLGFRDKETEIFDALKMIFKTKSPMAAKLAIINVDRDPQEIFWWIEQNVANEYEKPEEIAKAYEALSKADLFRRWITIRQNWRFLVYMMDLMTAGVATAKKEMYRKFTRYEYPQRIKMMSLTKSSREKLKQILKILSEHLHCSTKTVLEEYLPFFKLFIKDPNFKKSLYKILDREQIEFLGLNKQ